MRRLQLLLILFVLFLSQYASAQLVGGVGGECYLPGHWLEIGQTDYGAFGANPPPGGYHPYPAGSNLAEVYDYGHDGWTTGAPPLMGDYTYPGSPYEGWGIQVGGAAGLNWAFVSNGAITGPGSLTGDNVSYVNGGGKLLANWSGTAAGGQLKINMETRVDTNASWVVVTSKLYNIGATTLNDLYYFRGCDPDNDEAHGGSFTTNNIVNYQNDGDHRVGVSGVGMTYTYAYLQLCTKDCRAKAFVDPDWPIDFYATDLSLVYAGTSPGGSTYTLGVNVNGDYGIGLVYSLGNLCAGDSTFVSYAYTFLNTPVGIDSAFPEPTLVVNGVPVTPAAAPGATYDTFNVCLFPGMTILPVDLSFANTGAWTWATWTWSPGTGLATTTGVVNTITTTALPPSITYTITGTAYNGCGASGGSCGTRVIYLTVLTCNGAVNNSPCYGDILNLNAPGDSTGATYSWHGPGSGGPVVGTTQSVNITPAVYADSGMYYVIKTVAGTSTLDSTYVYIRPKPVLNLSTNAPLCIGMAATLTLSVTPVVAGETFAWSGPSGFTSALPDPTRPGYNAADTGIYTLIASTTYGCKDTASIDATIVNPPGAPVISGQTQYCYGTTFVPFTVAGSNIKWYPTDTSTVGATTVAPTVNTFSPGTYTFFATQTLGCESPMDSITVIVYPPVTPNFTYVIHPGCVQDTVIFTNTSVGASSYSWNFGDGTPAVTTTDATHIFSTHAIQNVTLTATFAICSNSITEHPDTRHTVQAAFTPVLDTICAGQASTMVDASTATFQGGAGVLTSYLWDFGDGTNSTLPGTTPAPGHVYNQAGIYNVVLTVADLYGCTSTANANVYVVSLTIHSWLDTTLCLRQPLPLTNYVTVYPDLGDLTNFTYSWTDPTANLNSDTAHIPYFTGYGTYSFTETAGLTGTDFGACPVSQTMVIHSVLGKPLSHVTANATILYGGSIQLNADSEVYYWWKPNDGSLNDPNINDPIATPGTTTLYTVYGMDQYGCVDSQFVLIRVDSDMHECIPSGFTPNGDGLNDVFRPVGITFQNIVDFRVFNRWGQQVFYTNSPEKGWDGTFNGVPQDMGVYFYNITVARPGGMGENIIYKGDVTLIR